MEKKSLDQGDLKKMLEYSNLYGIELVFTTQFILSIFSARFSNMDVALLTKNHKATSGKFNIEIDDDILIRN